MPFSFLPRLITEELTDITPELLRSRGIKLLMLDFDNTIVPYTTTVPTEKMEDWLTRMNALEDIQVCIVSNSHNDRVPKFCRERGMEVITHAKKPFSKGINQCLAKFCIEPGDAALVGDQIFTDTWGAHNSGVTPLLVKPIRMAGNPGRYLRYAGETPFRLIGSRRPFV